MYSEDERCAYMLVINNYTVSVAVIYLYDFTCVGVYKEK